MRSGAASIGECMLELSARTDGGWSLGHAGDSFNVAWALRALLPEETPVDYVSAFGDDPFSAQQQAFFRDHGIGTASSPVVEGGRPGLYAITLDGAERSFTYWRGDSAARQLASDPAKLEESLRHQGLVYFSGITLAILEPAARETLLQAIGKARGDGARIAFDPNYRPRLWREPDEARVAVTHALSVCDIALPTFPDEKSLFGDSEPAATAARITAAGVPEIVVKDGADPALLVDDGVNIEVAAVHVATPVDTTGAGDSFNGGYLAARLLGHGPAAAARKGHQVAAAVVQVRGALAPFETIRTAFGTD